MKEVSKSGVRETVYAESLGLVSIKLPPTGGSTYGANCFRMGRIMRLAKLGLREQPDSAMRRAPGLDIPRLLRAIFIILSVPLVATGCSSDSGEAAHSRAVESSQQKAQADSPASAVQRLEELTRSYVTEMYGIKGLSKPSEADLKSISGDICSDIRNGGDGQYFHTTYGPSGSNSASIAAGLNYAYATISVCDLTSSFEEGNSARELMMDVLVAHIGAESSTSATSGAVDCADGTTSDAGGSQGACSWHGGIED